MTGAPTLWEWLIAWTIVGAGIAVLDWLEYRHHRMTLSRR